jgi:O-antigen/teichoic acid export membrane protein
MTLVDKFLTTLGLAESFQLMRSRFSHREKRAAKAMGVGFFGRIITLVTSFVSTSMLVVLLGGQEGYGIFVTISSIVGWIQLSNLGFGLGLQNTLIAAVAQNDIERQRRLITTTQFCLLAICSLVFVIWSAFFLLHAFSWEKILNAGNSVFAVEVNRAVFISGCLIILQILLSYVAPYYIAHQRLHVYSWWVFASQLSGFAGLLFAVWTKQSLVGLILFYQGLPAGVLVLNAIWATVKDPAMMFPLPRFFSMIELRRITAIGMSFMLIMITGSLQYGLDNIIISRTLSPAEVTPYNLITKLFLVWYTMSSIIFTPLWGAFGNAFASNEIDWLKRRFSQIRFALLMLFSVFFLGIVLFGKLAIRLWVGPGIHVSITLIVLVGFYYLLRQWLDIYSMLINAVNAVKASAALALPCGLISAVCMYLGAKWGGVNGMLIGMSVAFLATGCWIMPLIARRAMAGKSQVPVYREVS